ncbi:hypothetical protein [Nitrosomonas communis]|uniref:hypothetical protein n=1 Tax=Nitrosomonas communis TaxID=44574 RepID=UPI003D2AD9CD
MGIHDRDYYREKRDYSDLMRENHEFVIDYSLKRPLRSLIRKFLIYFSLFLILVLIINYYESQIRAFLQTKYRLPSNTVIQPKPDQINGSRIISSCISNKTNCICYGKSSERLDIPNEICQKAVKYGWSSDAQYSR